MSEQLSHQFEHQSNGDFENPEVSLETERFSEDHAKRLENAVDFLEGRELEGKVLERLKQMVDTKNVLATALILERNPDLLKDEKSLGHLKSEYKKTIKRRLVPKMILLDDTEGEERFMQIAEQAFAERINWLEECKKIAHEHDLDEDGISKKMEAISKQQQELVRKGVEGRVPAVMEEFSQDEIESLVANIDAVELTKGCSIGCDFCAFEAEKGVKDALPFADAAWLMTRRDKVMPYFASDPLDYVASDDPSKTYADIALIHESMFSEHPGASTAYPRGKKQEVQKMGDLIQRISVSHVNKYRLVKDGLFERTEKGSYLPKDQAVIDIMFNSLSGIEDQARRIDAVPLELAQNPTYESAAKRWVLGPVYQGYSVIHDFFDESFLVSSGKNLEETNDFEPSIDCRDGVLVSIDGVHNTVRTFTTNEYRRGYASARVTAETLREGRDKIKEIKQDLDNGQEICIDEILPFGVVTFSDRPGQSRFNVDQINHDKEFYKYWSKHKKDFGEYFVTNPEHHKVVLQVLEPGQENENWICSYHLKTGLIQDLKLTK